MINYKEKGEGLHKAIEQAGYWLREIDGVWISSDDALVQVIIDNYDYLSDLKDSKIEALKDEAVKRANVKYSNINSFDDMLMMRDIILSIAPAARQLTTNIQYIADIYQAGLDAKTVVNDMTAEADIQSYDVVNTPAWPVG